MFFEFVSLSFLIIVLFLLIVVCIELSVVFFWCFKFVRIVVMLFGLFEIFLSLSCVFNCFISLESWKNKDDKVIMKIIVELFFVLSFIVFMFFMF